MYLKTRKEANTYERKSKLGKKVVYTREKAFYVIQCDNCGATFERDTNTTKKQLKANHLCEECFHPGKVRYFGKGNTRHELGDKWVDGVGYVIIKIAMPTHYGNLYHPTKNCGYIREHLKVMQDHIGRPLNENEVVHHIDGNKTNNDISNLDLCTKQQHNACHAGSEEIVFELYKKGIVGYNRETKRYYLA